MSEILNKQPLGAQATQGRDDASHPLFCAQAALLSQRFLHYYWSGDIGTCSKFLDQNVCLIESNIQKSVIGKERAVDFLGEQRLKRTPDYRGQDERYEVEPIVSNACTVNARYRVPAGYEDSRSNVFCSFFWTIGEDGLPQLQLCNYSSRSDQEIAAAFGVDSDVTDAKAGGRRERCVALQAHDTSGTTHWVYPHNVIYVAAAHQYTDIYCRDRLIHLRASFTQVLEQLDGVVVRIHRSYAVNPSYISHMEGEGLHLTNGTVLPIPVKRVRQVRELLSEYSDKLGDRS